MVDSLFCFTAVGKSTPVSKFHVVNPNKLEKPFVITVTYIGSDRNGMREEHNVPTVFLNEENC